MTAGIGTLAFHLVTKGRVPIFLGSCFAFIAPSSLIPSRGSRNLDGIIGVRGLFSNVGTDQVARQETSRPLFHGGHRSVIILIGLSLSTAAVDMAKTNWRLSFIALVTANLVLSLARGLLRFVP
jgi:uracil permease